MFLMRLVPVECADQRTLSDNLAVLDSLRGCQDALLWPECLFHDATLCDELDCSCGNDSLTSTE